MTMLTSIGLYLARPVERASRVLTALTGPGRAVRQRAARPQHAVGCVSTMQDDGVASFFRNAVTQKRSTGARGTRNRCMQTLLYF
eukprot:COSAG03_NODE_19955_length_327_cov_0.679825_2_plen_84_part_01